MGKWVSTAGWYAIDVKEGLTARNHDGGALVLFANSPEDARRRAEDWVTNHRLADDGPSAQWKPHREFQINSVQQMDEDEFYVFADMGCC